MYYAGLLRTTRALAISLAVLLVAVVLNFTLLRAYHVHIPSTAHALPVPLYAAFTVGDFFAIIFAFVLSGLADENDGHLAVAWTKPVAREGYALARFGVEAAGVVMMFLATSVFAYLAFVWIGAVSGFAPPADWPAQTARFILLPIAYYAFAQALTASVGKPAGLIRGLSLTALYVLTVLATTPLPEPYAAIVHAMNIVNPWTYMSAGFDDSGHATAAGTLVGYAGLTLITAAGLSAALAQWRRLEA